MPRDYRAHENERKAKARRAFALLRRELDRPTEPRKVAASPTSAAVKVQTPADALLIEAWLRGKQGGQNGG